MYVTVEGVVAFEMENGEVALCPPAKMYWPRYEVLANESTSSRIPASWFATDFTSLAFIVPLLAEVASPIACVSCVTTPPSAESATCIWPCTTFEDCVKLSSFWIWFSNSTFSPAASGSWLNCVTRTPLDSSLVNCCRLPCTASRELTRFVT